MGNYLANFEDTDNISHNIGSVFFVYQMIDLLRLDNDLGTYINFSAKTTISL